MIGRLTHPQFSIFQKDSSPKIWMPVIKKAECSKKNINFRDKKSANSKRAMLFNSFLTVGKFLKISLTSSVN